MQPIHTRLRYNTSSAPYPDGTMKPTLLLLLLLATSIQATDRNVLDTPLLFTKRFNYQGLHIYDSFYQWRPGGGIYFVSRLKSKLFFPPFFTSTGSNPTVLGLENFSGIR